MNSTQTLKTDFNKTDNFNELNKLSTKAVQSSTNIDFNYPSLNRKDLMFFSVITEKDAPMKKFKQLHTKRNWSINLYNLDIEGSSPRKFGAYNQKIDFINKNDDIEKSSPKRLHIPLKNKPEYNLSNKDIEFSHPHCVRCKITRHTNPLEPKYKLPYCPSFPNYEPKFIRDNININDIEGSKPKKLVSNNVLRESLKNDDVKDSWPKKPYIRKSKYEYMDYRDVTNTDFKSKRVTNPLDPFYKLNYLEGNQISKILIGPIEKNKPVVYSNYLMENPLNLKLNDIEGSNVGSKNKFKNFIGKNFCYNNNDIIGAQSGTLLKGISTKRMTNPIWPKYKYPGQDELKGFYENNPYKSYNNLAIVTQSKSAAKLFHKKAENNKKNSGEIIENKQNIIENNDKNLKKSVSDTNIPLSNDNKKILNKKMKIMENCGIDFGNVPYEEDFVEFDKNKFKKPTPFYSVQHDKFLIPPIEDFKRNKIDINPDFRNFQEMTKEKIKFMKKNKVSAFPSEPHKTYETKLDDFMTMSSLKNNDPQKQKNIQTFMETGLPNNVNDTDENQINAGILLKDPKNISKKDSTQKIPEIAE